MHTKTVCLVLAAIIVSGCGGGGKDAASCKISTNIERTKPNSIYTVNGDGTVIDEQTGLMWTTCNVSASYANGSNNCDATSAAETWGSTMKLVQTRNTQAYLGYSDWRVPNIKELASLLDDGCDGVKINTEVFKDTGYLGWFWSSSVDPNSRTNALRLNIHTGEVGSEYKGSESGTGYYGHIRLVRDAD